MKIIFNWIDIFLGMILIVYVMIINLISSNRIAFSIPLLLIGILLIGYHIIKEKFKEKRLILKARKLIRILVCIGLICFAIIETAIIVYPKNDKGSANYIIVLGAGLKNGTDVSMTLEDRLKAAISCINKYDNNASIIVSGGRGSDEKISEAKAMKNYLVSKGLEEDRIIVEDKSTNTSENFKYSKKIIEENSGKSISENKIKVVTTDFHAFRSSIIARKNGYKNIEMYSSDTIWYLIPTYYIREGIAVVKTVIFD